MQQRVSNKKIVLALLLIIAIALLSEKIWSTKDIRKMRDIRYELPSSIYLKK